MKTSLQVAALAAAVVAAAICGVFVATRLGAARIPASLSCFCGGVGLAAFLFGRGTGTLRQLVFGLSLGSAAATAWLIALEQSLAAGDRGVIAGVHDLVSDGLVVREATIVLAMLATVALASGSAGWAIAGATRRSRREVR
jgi:hypothetical protein